MQEDLYLGVDGGGTTCRVRLYDSEQQPLAVGAADSASTRLGVEKVWNSILEATRQALQAASMTSADMRRIHAGMGLAGAATEAERSGVANHAHPFASVRVRTDAHAAVLGIFAGGDGGILIVGTGSCGMAHVDGHFQTVGGWGFPVSDHGSGAWMGLRAIREALLAHEGQRESTPLVERIMARFGGDPGAALVWQYSAQPRDYGTFVPLVFAAADAGDPLAQEIVATSGTEAARLLDRLLQLGVTQLCLCGGLSERTATLLPARLQEQLVAPRGDAMDGGLHIARGRAGDSTI